MPENNPQKMLFVMNDYRSVILSIALPLTALLPVHAQTYTNADLVAPGATNTTPRSVTLPDGTVVGNGESLNLGGVIAQGGGATAVSVQTNELIVNGGTLNLEHAVRNTGSSQNSVQYQFSNALTLNSGQINFGAPNSVADRGFGTAVGVRIQTEGNFTMNGGSIVNQPGATASQFWLRGAQNTIGAGSVVSSDVTWVLNRSQTFRSAVALGAVQVRTSGQTEYTIGHTNANETLRIASLSLHQQTANRTATLRLGSNVATDQRLTLSGAPSEGTTTYVIDTAGYTLDMSADGNRWEPNTRDNNTTNWNLQGGGEIRASSFRFNQSAQSNVTVGANTSLRATKSDVTNILDSASFHATSSFIYDADAPGYITATTPIGRLVVEQGQLFTAGSNNIAAAGGVVIEAGAGLGFRYNRLVTGPSYTFKIEGSEAGRIVFAGNYDIQNGVDTFSLSGQNFIIEIGEIITGDQSWSLFDSQIALSGQLNSLTISGQYSITDFTREGTNLVGTNGELKFSFSEATGEFSVTAIPESSTYSMIIGAVVLGVFVFRRRLR